MFPKVGDIVKLNPDFLKTIINSGSEDFKKEKWKEKLKIIEIQEKSKKFYVLFETKDSKYRLYILILPNGELSSSCKEFKDIQVFITADIENNNNGIYCSCGGPKKESWVFGERFYICTICKKEKIQT